MPNVVMLNIILLSIVAHRLILAYMLDNVTMPDSNKHASLLYFSAYYQSKKF